MNRVFFLVFIISIIYACEKRSFTEKIIIETGEVSKISYHSIKVIGNVVRIGEGVKEHGHVCFDRFNSTIQNSFTTNFYGNDVPGTYISSFDSLFPNTAYAVYSYASDGVKKYFGDTIFFITANYAILNIDIIDYSYENSKLIVNSQLESNSPYPVNCGVIYDKDQYFEANGSYDYLGIVKNKSSNTFSCEFNIEKGVLYYFKAFAIIDNDYLTYRSSDTKTFVAPNSEVESKNIIVK